MTGSLGTQRNRWIASESHVDMSQPRAAPRKLELPSTPQSVTIDLNRTALLVIDMQNDFCAADGMVGQAGGNYSADRAPIEPLNRLTPALRAKGVPIIWVNWGNRADLANMAPNQVHLFKPTGTGLGLGDPLPGNGPGSGARILQKDSWAAAIVDELDVADTDLRVDKHRISGFWDTPLDSILRNLDVQTILFAGVNTDQCVLCTLTDANFLGYGCVLLEDCCATSSPAFCTEATLWNVRKCFGFVTGAADVISGLAAC
ncbi:pyrimidine utilization protein B [soil metagenome]